MTGRRAPRPPARCAAPDNGTDRAQSHVVGVALMVGLTVLALAGLTGAIGSVVQDGATNAEVDRVADGMAAGIDPTETTGTAEADLQFADGQLRTESRTVRILDASNPSADPTADPVIEAIDSDALVYERGDDRAVAAAGAVVRAGDGGGYMYADPAITADRGSGGVLVVGAPRIDAEHVSYSTDRALRLRVRTHVSHDRTDLGEGEFRIAVETDYPHAWAEYFERQGMAVVTTDTEFDGDDRPSVIAHVPGERQAHLVVSETDLEVQRR